MKNDKYEKELEEIDRKYRWRMNIAWAFLALVLVWIAFVL